MARFLRAALGMLSRMIAHERMEAAVLAWRPALAKFLLQPNGRSGVRRRLHAVA